MKSSKYLEVSFVDSYTDQDDDGSEAEADEGLQEAPGVQNYFELMEIRCFGFLAKREYL